MKYADIVRCVASLPATDDRPGMLSRATVTAQHFLMCAPHEWKDLPPLAVIEAAVMQGKQNGRGS
jgi:hypothetical protein